ncbi:sensor histidine kinase [Aeromicrobium sp. Leaf350]|uniref:sensor histidine kinase n=1 Tax=Aeromicrobium sp. Leaf350 TaxID=2876565 RepID=UPI001E306D2B|nr:histidine kinase [Aeromicrobium sp. Leaf350]
MLTSGARAAGGPTWVRLVGAGIWLVFLTEPVQVLLAHDGIWGGVGVAAVVVFVAAYVVGLLGVQRAHERREYLLPALLVAAMLMLTALTIPGAGDESLVLLVFVVALAAASLPARWAVVVTVALVLVAAVSGRTVDGWDAHGNDFAIILAAGAVWSFRLALQRQRQLARAEQDLAELAIEEERTRIARDLHDILGHSLTVISVKSELAGRLLATDPERAQSELADVQRLARDALADVRSTTSGLQALSLPREIAAARSALTSAGIHPHLPTVAEVVPSQWRELYAWVLRESVTNVVRHSGARACWVEVDERSMRVWDDGRGTGAATAGGTGLEGLRYRTRRVGAVLHTGPGPDGAGFAVEVVVPA